MGQIGTDEQRVDGLAGARTQAKLSQTCRCAVRKKCTARRPAASATSNISGSSGTAPSTAFGRQVVRGDAVARHCVTSIDHSPPICTSRIFCPVNAFQQRRDVRVSDADLCAPSRTSSRQGRSGGGAQIARAASLPTVAATLEIGQRAERSAAVTTAPGQSRRAQQGAALLGRQVQHVSRTGSLGGQELGGGRSPSFGQAARRATRPAARRATPGACRRPRTRGGACRRQHHCLNACTSASVRPCSRHAFVAHQPAPTRRVRRPGRSAPRRSGRCGSRAGSP